MKVFSDKRAARIFAGLYYEMSEAQQHIFGQRVRDLAKLKIEGDGTEFYVTAQDVAEIHDRIIKGRFSKGFIPWNKGKKLNYAGHAKPHTAEARAKMSAALKGRASWSKGKQLSRKHRENLRKAHLGRMLPPGHREKIRQAMQKYRGENNPNYRPIKPPRSKYKSVKCPPEYAEMAKKDGMVSEHRLIMARSLGRPLRNTEVVDHINRDTLAFEAFLVKGLRMIREVRTCAYESMLPPRQVAGSGEHAVFTP
ncbi:MAG TPA: NUMOD3 domain-containing DNA-binding protein [Candidatus Paceibacterota bacterium]|nr:NUMOD3 domain-containing DNA-binding protein [Candidatus Paceibacterota bacterium]